MATGFVLLESGDKVLLESGDDLVLENHTQVVSLTAVTETDQAQELGRYEITPVTETDTALGIFLPAQEVDTAPPLRLFYPGPIAETDAAQELRLYYPGPIAEADGAQALRYHFGPAAILNYDKAPALVAGIEADAPQVLVVTHVIRRTLTPITEVDASAVLSITGGATTRKTLVPALEAD